VDRGLTDSDVSIISFVDRSVTDFSDIPFLPREDLEETNGKKTKQKSREEKSQREGAEDLYPVLVTRRPPL